MSAEEATPWQVIRRGWAKRCPHCGRGSVFVRWTRTRERCAVCGYLFERDQGETWGVWIITDRVPIAVGIIAVFFGFRVTSIWVGLAFMMAMILPLILTMPRRHSLAIALVYLSRRAWPDPEDSLPTLPL